MGTRDAGNLDAVATPQEALINGFNQAWFCDRPDLPLSRCRMLLQGPRKEIALSRKPASVQVNLAIDTTAYFAVVGFSHHFFDFLFSRIDPNGLTEHRNGLVQARSANELGGRGRRSALGSLAATHLQRSAQFGTVNRAALVPVRVEKGLLCPIELVVRDHRRWREVAFHRPFDRTISFTTNLVLKVQKRAKGRYSRTEPYHCIMNGQPARTSHLAAPRLACSAGELAPFLCQCTRSHDSAHMRISAPCRKRCDLLAGAAPAGPPGATQFCRCGTDHSRDRTKLLLHQRRSPRPRHGRRGGGRWLP